MSETRFEHQKRLKEEAYDREQKLNIKNGNLQAELKKLKLDFNQIQKRVVI